VPASLTSIVGGVLGYSALAHMKSAIPYALAAASFIYIAIADLIPTLNRHTGFHVLLSQTCLFAAE
jgi:zinc and cadmium transporter